MAKEERNMSPCSGWLTLLLFWEEAIRENTLLCDGLIEQVSGALLLSDWIILVVKGKIIYFPPGARAARVQACHMAPANLEGSRKPKQQQK